MSEKNAKGLPFRYVRTVKTVSSAGTSPIDGVQVSNDGEEWKPLGGTLGLLREVKTVDEWLAEHRPEREGELRRAAQLPMAERLRWHAAHSCGEGSVMHRLLVDAADEVATVTQRLAVSHAALLEICNEYEAIIAELRRELRYAP